nr:response regulator [Caulobacter sp. 17J80-11]
MGRPHGRTCEAKVPECAVKTVLVVDDEALILDLIATALEEAGYRVLRAAHGIKAMDVLAAERPDLIVTDYMMPLMNGQELAVAVRSDPQHIALPIILLSGAQSFLARGRRDLFDAVFEKPFDVDELTAEVANRIGAA